MTANAARMVNNLCPVDLRCRLIHAVNEVALASRNGRAVFLELWPAEYTMPAVKRICGSW